MQSHKLTSKIKRINLPQDKNQIVTPAWLT